MDFLRVILDHAEAFRWLFLLLLMLVFYRWMQGNNGIEWRDFISAEKPDGTYRGDINRVGQCIGVVCAAFAIIATVPKAHTDFAGFALVLATCFALLGGVAAYAAKLRSQSGQTQTTVTTEPLPSTAAPVKTTTVTTEPAVPTGTDTPVPVVIVAGPGKEEPMKVKEQGK